MSSILDTRLELARQFRRLHTRVLAKIESAFDVTEFRRLLFWRLGSHAVTYIPADFVKGKPSILILVGISGLEPLHQRSGKQRRSVSAFLRASVKGVLARIRRR